jgi:hypothetical protein
LDGVDSRFEEVNKVSVRGSVLSLFIAWVTVRTLTLKAAKVNPVESLKYE